MPFFAKAGIKNIQHSIWKKLEHLTAKGPRVFWCKTTQNYPLLKKEPIILF
jgi:hypothetical protein